MKVKERRHLRKPLSDIWKGKVTIKPIYHSVPEDCYFCDGLKCLIESKKESRTKKHEKYGVIEYMLHSVKCNNCDVKLSIPVYDEKWTVGPGQKVDGKIEIIDIDFGHMDFRD